MTIEVKCSDPSLSFTAELTESFIEQFATPQEAFVYFFHNLHLPRNLNSIIVE